MAGTGSKHAVTRSIQNDANDAYLPTRYIRSRSVISDISSRFSETFGEHRNRCQLMTCVLSPGMCDEDDDDPEPDYDVLGDDLDDMNPDIVSCGAESSRRRKGNSYTSKTLRGAFVKRYNALSKRSSNNKPKNQRPAVHHVFNNVSYED